jgi:hypothetical protein
MANILPGYIKKSGTPEGILGRMPQYENLGAASVYAKGSTTALTIDNETTNKWSGYKLGDVFRLRLRYLRTAGGTQIEGGTDDQYVIKLPDVVNIDAKRVTECTAAAVTSQTIGTAVIGKGYAMSANGTAASLAQALLYDTDAKTFRLLFNRIDDDGVTHIFQSYAGDGGLGWGHNDSGDTTLSFVVDFDVPVTD